MFAFIARNFTVSMVVIALLALVCAVVFTSHANEPQTVRSFARGEVRTFVLNTGEYTARIERVVLASEGLKGLEVQEFERFPEKGILGVKVRTTTDLPVNLPGERTIIAFVLLDSDFQFLGRVEVEAPVHVGMPGELLASTGRFGGSGEPIYSAPHWTTVPTDKRLQVLQRGELRISPSIAETFNKSPIELGAKWLRKDLRDAGWVVVDPTRAKVDVRGKILDAQFQSEMAKTENISSVDVLAIKDRARIISRIWTDTLTGRQRFIVAFDEPHYD